MPQWDEERRRGETSDAFLSTDALSLSRTTEAGLNRIVQEIPHLQTSAKRKHFAYEQLTHMTLLSSSCLLGQIFRPVEVLDEFDGIPAAAMEP